MALNSFLRVSAFLVGLDHRTSRREVPSRKMEPLLAPSHYVRSDYSRCTNPWFPPVILERLLIFIRYENDSSA